MTRAGSVSARYNRPGKSSPRAAGRRPEGSSPSPTRAIRSPACAPSSSRLAGASGSSCRARALARRHRFDQPARFIASSDRRQPGLRSTSSPSTGCTPSLRQAWTNSIAPESRRWSVRPRAGMPSAAAAWASSAGRASPSCSEKAEWVFSATYIAPILPGLTLPAGWNARRAQIHARQPYPRFRILWHNVGTLRQAASLSLTECRVN